MKISEKRQGQSAWKNPKLRKCCGFPRLVLRFWQMLKCIYSSFKRVVLFLKIACEILPEASHSRVVQAATKQQAMASLRGPVQNVSPWGCPREAGPWRQRSQHLKGGDHERGQRPAIHMVSTRQQDIGTTHDFTPKDRQRLSWVWCRRMWTVVRAGARVETSRYCGYDTEQRLWEHEDWLDTVPRKYCRTPPGHRSQSTRIKGLTVRHGAGQGKSATRQFRYNCLPANYRKCRKSFSGFHLVMTFI